MTSETLDDNTSEGINFQLSTPSLLSLSGPQLSLLKYLEKQDRNLNEDYPCLGKIYLGGLKVLNDRTNPDKFSQSAHSFRELIEKLPILHEVPLKIQKPPSQTEKVRDLLDNYRRSKNKSGCYSSSSQWSGDIDSDLKGFLSDLEEFSTWFEECYPKRRDELQKILNHYDRSDRKLPESLVKNKINEWNKIRKYFLKITHHGGDANEQEFRDKIAALEEFLLDLLVPKTFNDFAQLDKILLERGQPSDSLIRQTFELIQKRRANYDYFLSKLISVEWLKPLANKGIFLNPPSSIRDEDMVNFPFWPESGYLTRMALEKPDQVFDIIMGIPETDNARIHKDLVQAAINFPGNLAAKWAREEIKWINKQEFLYVALALPLGELIEHLANSGELRTSLGLSRAVLSVTLEGDDYKRPATRINDWEYSQILEKHFTRVLGQTGLDGLNLLCDLLNDALAKDIDEDDDYSYIWRPAIEPHEQNRRHGDVRNSLIDAIRDGVLFLLENEHDLGTIIEDLIRRQRPVFIRIVLHLLSQNSMIPAVNELMCNKDYFFDIRLRHEYNQLLGAYFSELSPESKAMIFGWIDGGLPRKELDDTADEKLQQEQNKRWQVERLVPIQSQLPKEWEQFYTDAVKEFGEPYHTDLVWSTATWQGPTSPMNSEELEAMSAIEISEFLKRWDPEGEMRSPTPEGLGRVLQDVIAKSVERFVTDIEAFKDVEPTYARALVEGVSEGVKTGHPVDWNSIIAYLIWIVEQPRDEIRESRRGLDIDPHWGWARKSTAKLLSIGFERNLISISFRDKAWSIISVLSDDPDPALQDDEQATMDPAMRSINTTRGEALHTVVRYAQWVREATVKQDLGDDKASFGMSTIPEVRDCLEYHLDPENDPSPAVRAVYGQWFPWLLKLDAPWTQENLLTIFPSDNQALRDAAWHTYLVFCRAYDEPFQILKEQYIESVSNLREGYEWRSGFYGNPGECLGKHLVVMFGRGRISWEDENKLVQNYFDNASVPDASHVISFIGQSLSDASSPIPPEVLGRFVIFWEHLSEHLQNGDGDRVQMLRAFSSWFDSGAFDNDWAFTHLLQVIETTGGIDNDFLVMERIEKLADDSPVQCLQVIKMLAKQDNGRWDLLDWKDSGEIVLKAALYNEETNETARNLIHELGARGYFQFRKLLADIEENKDISS